MRLGNLNTTHVGRPSEIDLAVWVRESCGYQIFCGRDRTVTNLTLKENAIVCATWGKRELPDREEDPDVEFGQLEESQKEEMSKPTTLLINVKQKLVTFLPPLRERGEYDRRHRLGYEWLDKHAENPTDWFAFQKTSEGVSTYFREDFAQWKQAASIAERLDFISEDTSIIILDSGICGVAKLASLKEGDTPELVQSDLKPEAAELVAAMRRIYEGESKLRNQSKTATYHDSNRVKRDLCEELLGLRKKIDTLIPINMEGEIDKSRLTFRGLSISPAGTIRISRYFKKASPHLALMEQKAQQEEACESIASFSFLKQILHDMVRDMPEEAVAIFGDSAIEREFSVLSG